MASDENQWGCWLTPDLLGGDITNPQSLNRYAYALNNPTTLTDPSGLGPNSCGPTNICIVVPVLPNPPGLGGGIGECSFFGCTPNCSIFACGAAPWSNNGGGGGTIHITSYGTSGSGAPNPTRPATGPVVPSNPCSVQGRALAPSDYAKTGKNDPWYSLNFTLDVKYGWGTGQYLDAQPLTSVPATWTAAAYGNYVYGVYMKAAQAPLWVALRGAEYYALKKTYPVGTPMQPWYPGLPAANAQNITNGYNAQANGTACQATTPLPPPPGS